MTQPEPTEAELDERDEDLCARAAEHARANAIIAEHGDPMDMQLDGTAKFDRARELMKGR